MDKEKLKKAISNHREDILLGGKLFDPTNKNKTWGELLKPYEESFAKGANWLMSQPLRERLTNEEIIKIRTIYRLAEKENNKLLLTYFKQNFSEEIFKSDGNS